MAGDDNTARDEPPQGYIVEWLEREFNSKIAYIRDVVEAIVYEPDLVARLAVSAADDTTTVRVERDDLRNNLDGIRLGVPTLEIIESEKRLRAALDPGQQQRHDNGGRMTIESQADEMQQEIVRNAAWLHREVGNQARLLANATEHGARLAAVLYAYMEAGGKETWEATQDAYRFFMAAHAGNFNLSVEEQQQVGA